MAYSYPPEFPASARARVLAMTLHAKRTVESDSRSRKPMILMIFEAFAEETLELGRYGIWSADRVLKEAEEFLRVTTIELGEYHMISNFGYIERCSHEEFEGSPEWKRFSAGLQLVAEMQGQAQAANPQVHPERNELPDQPDPVESEEAEHELNLELINQWITEQGVHQQRIG